MAVLHNVADLIDMALGVPKIGVVNFSILKALLQVIANELFNIGNETIELIHKDDGKIIPILHRYDKGSQDRKIKTKKNTQKTKLHKLSKKCGVKGTNIIDINKDVILKAQEKQTAALMEAHNKLNKAILDFQKPQSKELLSKDFSSLEAQKKQANTNTFIKVQKKQYNALLQIVSNAITDENSSIDNYSSQLTSKCDTYTIDLQNNEGRNSETDNSLNDNDHDSENNQPFSNRSERLRAGFDHISDSEIERQNSYTDDIEVYGNRESVSSTSNFESKRINDILVKINLLEFEQTRLQDDVVELKKTKDIKKLNDKIEKFESYVYEELKKAKDSTVIKNDHLKMLISEYEDMRTESANYKKEVKNLATEIRRDVHMQKELGEKIVFPTPLSKTQFEFFQEKFFNFETDSKNIKSNFDSLQNEFVALKSKHEDIELNIMNINSILGQDTKNRPIVNLLEIRQELNDLKEVDEKSKIYLDKIRDEQDTFKNELDQIDRKLQSLNSLKLDRDDIEELLAEKADYGMLLNKVSIESFDINRRNIENFIKKTDQRLNEHDATFQCKLIALNEALDTKMDQSDLALFKEAIKNDLITMISKITTIPNNKETPEAAGAHKGLLQNVNCLSCDKYVVMRTNEFNNGLPKIKNSHLTGTIRPEIVYKLDKIATSRKENINPSNSRNMHHYELITNAYNKWITNDQHRQKLRHCGGSHTKITNRDRLDCGIGYSGRPKSKIPNAICIKMNRDIEDTRNLN